MTSAMIFLLLQAGLYGPSLPAKPKAATEVVAADCPQSSSGEIVVCKRRRATPNQRVQGGVDAVPDQRLNLKLGDKAKIGGGGPMGQKGQSVGVGVSIPF